MKISVIIPAYNQAQYLPDAIESALQADEVIVVIDGSPDKSLEIADKYAYDNLGKLSVVSQVNKGLASARNTGIMNATGDYILPLDADDILMDGAIEKIKQKIEETSADIVAPSFKTFGTSNVEIILQKPKLEDFREANRLGYFSAMRKSMLLAVGGYSPKMREGWEDLHLWIDLLKRGYTVEVIEEPLVLYRTKEESMYTNSVKFSKGLWAQINLDHKELWNTPTSA